MNTNRPSSRTPTTGPFGPADGALRATLAYLALSAVASLLAGAYIVNWPAFIV